VRTFTVKTPLDGAFTARLHAPTKARFQVALYAGATLLGRGTSVRYSICGARILTLKVRRTSGSGTFSLDVSKP
jgi:hypothetical protein